MRERERRGEGGRGVREREVVDKVKMITNHSCSIRPNNGSGITVEGYDTIRFHW